MTTPSGTESGQERERARDLVPASRLYLPTLANAPATVLDHLCTTHPHVPKSDWERRVDRGLVRFGRGMPVTRQTPYRERETVVYRREVPNEPPPETTESILFEDEAIVVADKPPGMPVTPAGEYLERSLLVRLRQRTGLAGLTPAHRLDRDTRGVLLFVVRPRDRGLYQRMFQNGQVKREYTALAEVPNAASRTTWQVENRLAPGTPWFRQTITDGVPNARSQIELVELQQKVGRFRIRPITGKRHQIRLHMASIGHPILGDSLYPELCPESTLPLALLAAVLAFEDPLTGRPRNFNSSMSLDLGEAAGGYSGDELVRR